MKKIISCVAAGAFVAAMLISGAPANASPRTPVTAAPALQAYGPPQQGYYPNEPWATPPAEYQSVQQKGFRDGVRGAYKDAQNHRPPNVNNRDEFRHPDVPHRDRRTYRDAFKRGYWTGVQHLMGYYHGRNPYGDRDDHDRR